MRISPSADGGVMRQSSSITVKGREIPIPPISNRKALQWLHSLGPEYEACRRCIDNGLIGTFESMIGQGETGATAVNTIEFAKGIYDASHAVMRAAGDALYDRMKHYGTLAGPDGADLVEACSGDDPAASPNDVAVAFVIAYMAAATPFDLTGAASGEDGQASGGPRGESPSSDTATKP